MRPYRFKINNTKVLSVLYDIDINQSLLENLVTKANDALLNVLNGPDQAKYISWASAPGGLIQLTDFPGFTTIVKHKNYLFTYHLGMYDIKLDTKFGCVLDLDHTEIQTSAIPDELTSMPLEEDVIYFSTLQGSKSLLPGIVIKDGIESYINFTSHGSSLYYDRRTVSGWFSGVPWFLKGTANTIFDSWDSAYKEFLKFKIDNYNITGGIVVTESLNSPANQITPGTPAVIDINTALSRLIPAPFKMTSIPIKDFNVTSQSRLVQQIINVYEFNNTRVFVAISGIRKDVYSYRSSASYSQSIYIGLIASSDRSYRYVDVGRKFILKDTDWVDPAKSAMGAVVFTDLGIKLPNDQEALRKMFEKYAQGKEVHPRLFDQPLVDLELSKISQSEKSVKEAEQESDLLRKKIEFKINGLKAGTEVFKVNGIEFRPDHINYESQILSIIGENWVGDFLSGLPRSSPASFLESLDFDQVRERFSAHIMKSLVDKTELKLRIGDIFINVEKRKSEVELKTGKKTESWRFYLNNERINSEEIVECLDRALCYSMQKEYNSFLDSVSKCSLRIHGYLQNGIQLELKNPFYGPSINLIFPLTRENGKNYIKIGDSKYKVKDTNKLIVAETYEYPDRVIDRLTDPTVIEDMDSGSLVLLIKSAIDVYKTKIVKAQEFLKKTEERFGLIKEHTTLDNGTSAEGYIVKGSIRDYFVEASGGYDVYSYPQGKHICMVDKSIIQSGVDKLIGRLYALKNDALVAQHINTLED